MEKLPLEFVKKVKDTINKQNTIEGEIKKTTEDGKTHWIQNSIMPIYDDNNIKIGEVIVNYDITDKKNFQKLAITDGLTNLYNRRFFNETLTREISRAIRDKNYLSFLILDVDFFKRYNDTYGHDAGDKALIAISNAMTKTLHRGGDFAFRLGGEEFGVLFSQCALEDSIRVADKIRKNIEALQIEHSNSQTAKHLTVSIGLLVVDFAKTSVDEHGFYTMADDALYQAKESGRNKVVRYKNGEVDFF
jgi:diguanylate cyclase (GGDEF)-like protein